MIRITITKNDSLKSILVKGHAKYDDFGKDIVCASVSSILITSINGIIKVKNDTVRYESREGLVKVEVLREDPITNILLYNMIDLFKELANDYPKNIKIEEVSL